MCVDVILHFITFSRGHSHTRKIRTRPEKQFRGPWTLAAESCSHKCRLQRCDAGHQFSYQIIKHQNACPRCLHNMRSLEQDYYWFFLSIGLHLYVLYIVVQYNYNFFVRKAVDQYFHLMSIPSVISFGMLLINI